jgi:hypothetical protein
LIGFSWLKFPFSAHPTRARARSTANSHFIFALLHGSGAHIPPASSCSRRGR